MTRVRSCKPLSAETFRQHALTDILPYWYEHALDREFGGYIPQLDRRWRITDHNAKNLVPTTRLIFNFCQGKLLDGPAWCAEAAKHGLDFLLEKFRDPHDGGWYWQVNRVGQPSDDQKATYGHAFAILALSEYHRAFGDTRALESARQTFDVLEEHAYTPEPGGYVSRFDRDWSNPESMRSQNPQMHLVEALLALYETSGDDRYVDRAAELCQLMNDRLFDHEHGCLPEFFNDDWSDARQQREGPVQPGHQMEWAWLLQRVYAYRPEAVFMERAKQMVTFAWEHGWDQEFGGYYTDLRRTGEVKNPNKSFWQQCEGVMAPLWLWGHTKDEAHRSMFEQSARYCFDRFVDWDTGGWFGGLSRDNRPRSRHKGGPWKADYHVVQMCAEVCRFLTACGNDP